MYGRLGMKPDKNRIDSYEYFVLGNCENLKMTRMLKVTISRYILLGEIFLFRFVLKKILILPIILKKTRSLNSEYFCVEVIVWKPFPSPQTVGNLCINSAPCEFREIRGLGVFARRRVFSKSRLSNSPAC